MVFKWEIFENRPEVGFMVLLWLVQCGTASNVVPPAVPVVIGINTGILTYILQTRFCGNTGQLSYPTLGAYEDVQLPQDTVLEPQELPFGDFESSHVNLLPQKAMITIFDVLKLHVVADCNALGCTFRPVYVYLHKTNWFNEPLNVTLESLAAALKRHAVYLIGSSAQAQHSHRGMISAKLRSWMSTVKPRLRIATGKACFMQPSVGEIAVKSGKKHLKPREVAFARMDLRSSIEDLFLNNQSGRVLLTNRGKLGIKPISISLEDLNLTRDDIQRIMISYPQNLLGLCRMPRDNTLRILGEKNFIFCSTALRAGKHIIDGCRDLPSSDVHVMKAIDLVHNRQYQTRIPKLPFVPTTLPPDPRAVQSGFVVDLQSDGNFNDVSSCLQEISSTLSSKEWHYAKALWWFVEVDHTVNAEAFVRSYVKYAFFALPEIAPSNESEYLPSLTKLANKWIRTTELFQDFNAAAASCRVPALRTIYFPQFQSKRLSAPDQNAVQLIEQLRFILELRISCVHRLVLGGAYLMAWFLNKPQQSDGGDSALLLEEFSELNMQLFSSFARRRLSSNKDLVVVDDVLNRIASAASAINNSPLSFRRKEMLVGLLNVLPYWIFAFGRHVGPRDKNRAYAMGYGLCPYYFATTLIDRQINNIHTMNADTDVRVRGQLVDIFRRLSPSSLPKRLGRQADIFINQQIAELPKELPELFVVKRRKIVKAFPPPPELLLAGNYGSMR